MAMEEIFISGTSGLLKKLVYAVDQVLDRDDHNRFAAQLKRLKGALEKIEAVTCDAERMQVNDPDVKLCLIKLKEVAYDADDVLDGFFNDAKRTRNLNPKYLLPDIIKNFDLFSWEMFKRLRKFGIGNTPSQSTQTQEGLTSHYAGRENDKSNIVSSSSSVDFNHSGLKLRYDNLSSHLKQCFSYFSLFPKDWKFDRETLIHMWMAEGFLEYQPSNGGNHNSLEDIGNEYFSNLLSCSLFQNIEYDDLGDIITFKLHNSVHDFASSVVGRHEVTVLSEREYGKSNRDKIRRLQLVLDEERPVDSTILFLGEKLRTIFCGYEVGKWWEFDERYNRKVANNRSSLGGKIEGLRLRVIHLSGVRHLILPIYSLIHLRYLHLDRLEIGVLDISKTNLLQTLTLLKCSNVQQTLQKIGSLTLLRHLSISSSDVEELPESIFKLFNLQTLDISTCVNISVLPTSVGFLQNLLSLDISNTRITELPDSITNIYSLRRLEFHHCFHLKALPSNFGALTQLSSLNFEGTRITELPDSIRRIYSLQRLNFRYRNDLKALPSNLGALTQLRSLNLEGSGITELPDSICGIYSLERLELRYCRDLKALPRDFGALRQLRSLNLEGSGIIELPDSICRINNLERLEFMNCSELKALPHDFGALTQLRSLNLEGTEITELPESLTSNLWKFESVNIRRLEVLMPYFVSKMEEKKNALPALRGRESSSGIKELAGLNSLRVLEIRYLENVTGFADALRADLRNKQNLRELSLKWEEEGANNNSVTVLENGLRPHPNLKKLLIESFGGLRLPKWMGSSSNYCLPHLVELYLSNCYRCEKLPALGLLPSLRVLWVYGIRSMKCLGQEFYYHIKEQDSEEEEDEEITIFPSLTMLELGDMDNLKEWVAPPHYYVSFPVLETLCIVGCSELTSIPDFQSCTSLRELTIEDCDKLSTESPSDVYQSPNSITTNRYLVKEITSGTPEESGIQDIAALETEKFLHISNLENVRGGKEGAIRAKLKDKQHLEDLYLSWNSSFTDDDEYIDGSVNDGIVLEGLLPHPNLKMLTISGFRGLNLPKWMGLSNCLPSVVHLYFNGCNGCEQLPALGMLPCLRILKIEGMNSVQCLAEEFYYQQQESSSSREIKEEEINTDKQATTSSSSSSSGISVFPSLVELSLIDMSILKEWAAPHLSLISFPSLERLIVSGCLRLKSIPFTSLSFLKSLELRNTNDEAVNLILANTGGERLTSLESVSIQYSPQLQFFPVVLLPSDTHIQSLEISHCSNFQGFRILDEFQAIVSSDTVFNTSTSSLRSLKLFDCPALMSLPDLQEWTSLTKLWIEDCDKLKDSFTYDLASLPSLQTLYVDRDIDLRQEY